MYWLDSFPDQSSTQQGHVFLSWAIIYGKLGGLAKAMKKSAFVAIVGRPSAGKSTLLNRICGHKISIVSSHPQTTRNKVRGILSEDRGQLVFVDTPGFHRSERKFNQQMMGVLDSALEECDLLLYVLDATRAPGEEEEELNSMLREREAPAVIALNKQDLGIHPAWEVFLASPQALAVPVHRISAMKDKGVKELLDSLFGASPEGPLLYPEDYYTDQDPEFRISEIIREQAMIRTREEIPHSLYVEIEDLEEDEENLRLWVRATIVVERQSQVGIVVGKSGEQIRDIRKESQRLIGSVFPQRIHLDLRVKASPKWRNRDSLLRRLIR